jgi:DeoR/GlpR family transcriptional regulator of sugar metabolism
MPNQLFLEERRRRILDALKSDGRVSVAELSDNLNVSAVTIRQDLKALEDEGLLDRTHGGAVIREIRLPEERELSFDVRRNKQLDEKDVIGKFAASLVHSGAAIALDASTTICSIIPHLSRLDNFSIITNNLLVPELVLDRPKVEVFVIGGRLRRDSYSLIGNIQGIPDVNISVGFLSAWGISAEAGVTELSTGEMEMKQTLLTRCHYKVLLLDSSKWGKIAPYTYANPNDVDLIVTTNRTPKAYLDQFHGANIKVIEM